MYWPFTLIKVKLYGREGLEAVKEVSGLWGRRPKLRIYFKGR